MGKKRPRPVVTDVAAVRVPSSTAGRTYDYVISRSYAETVDLISEGPIEGIVSGSYQYVGEKNETGYSEVTFTQYKATGANGSDSNELGFLRSIYWNEVPIVDKDGFYNFADINLQAVKGDPIGHIPQLESTNMGADQVMDLSVARSIGDRLYGPEIDNTEAKKPGRTRSATLKAGTKIDKYAKTYSILNKECTQIDVNIRIPGMFENIQHGRATYKKSKYLRACRKRATGKGDTKAYTVEYWIYYQPLFDERFSNDKTETQKWIGPVREIVTGKIDSPYIRTTKIDLSGTNFQDKEGFQGWRIRIARITPESLTSFIQSKSFVDSIIEVYGNKLRYPYCSMVYSRFDAANFSRIPSRAYDTRLLKVKVPNNYNPIARTYGNSNASGAAKTNCEHVSPFTTWTKQNTNTPFWNGEFSEELQWTNNPAWCFYDLITNPRYGLGEYISEDQVDKWALYDIAQQCDILVDDGYGGVEPQFTMNYIITSREEAFKVLNDLASVFRGITYYSNGSIFAIQDKFKKPVFQFNNSNVVDGNFNYSSSAKRARHTVAIVRYNDKRNLHQPAVEYVEDEEAVRRYGIREIETTALGCTSRGQARRFAEWILASESQETETVTFSVGQDGAYLNPGDVIELYDNYRNPLKQSGRTNAVRPIQGNGVVESLSLLETKSGYVNGTYTNINLSGGSGSSLVATITVSSSAGAIITVNNIQQGDVYYSNGTFSSVPVESTDHSYSGPPLFATVTVSNSSVTSIVMDYGGDGFEVGDSLLIQGYDLIPLNDINEQYIPADGGNITFDVASTNTTAISSISVTNGGTSYSAGETVTIPQGSLGTNSPATNLRVGSTAAKKIPASSAFDSQAYNSIILDQILDFTDGTNYKLSLLTPTYDYPTNTIGLDSTDAEVSRSALQTLYFRGQDTRTITGDYRSDFTESGSGAYPGGSVCTEIYFNSGLNPDGTLKGTGNQLDFDNYVITGYANNQVLLQTDAPSSATSSEYSGGCFSGENLIWSIEPSSTSPEFISGKFENYRIINIQENEQGYNVSALFYSTGKYDNVISATTLDSVYAPLAPRFATGDQVGRIISSPIEGTPTRGVLSTFGLTEGQPAVEGPSAWQTEGLPPTLELTIERAGYGDLQNSPSDTNLQIETSTVTVNDDISYIICAHYSNSTGPKYTGSTVAPTSAAANKQMIIVDKNLFEDNYRSDIVQLVGQGNENNNKFMKKGKVYVEFFIDQVATTKKYIYVTVFAQSPEGELSDGMMKVIEISSLSRTNYLSIVDEINIEPLEIEGKTATAGLVNLESMEPSFQWKQTFPAEYYTNSSADGEASDVPHNKLYPGVAAIDYRITIRDQQTNTVDSSAASKILVEVTGYGAESTTPSFIFESLYNDPDTVTDLLNQGYKVYVKGVVQNPNNNQIAVINPDAYIQVPESGFNIVADPKFFPVRKFDIYVEAHDGKGRTSSNNQVGDNTIQIGTADGQEVFDKPGKFQNFGANILAPSGVFFARTKGTMGQPEDSLTSTESQFKRGIKISATTAHRLKYPYVASARATTDGSLFLSFKPATDVQGNSILDESEIEDVFENVRGLVYYCTTGDNTAEFVQGDDGKKRLKYLNPAPSFQLVPDHIKSLPTSVDELANTNSGNYGFVGSTGNHFFGSKPRDAESNSYDYSIIKPAVGLSESQINNLSVIRGSYVLKEEDSIDGFLMPFPVIGDTNVTNVNITIGFFDALSLNAGFDDDEITPRFDQFQNSHYGNVPNTTVKLNRIFKDSSINFSSLPIDDSTEFSLEGFEAAGGGSAGTITPFTYGEGTPMFLGESSNLTSQDSANAYRGWGEINLIIDKNFPGPDLREDWFHKYQPVDSKYYQIISQSNDYFNAEDIEIQSKGPKTISFGFGGSSNANSKRLSVIYNVKFSDSIPVDKYSVFLGTPTYRYQKNIQTFDISTEDKIASPELGVLRGELKTERMTQVIQKTSEGFKIEYLESIYPKLEANYISIKFGILISE